MCAFLSQSNDTTPRRTQYVDLSIHAEGQFAFGPMIVQVATIDGVVIGKSVPFTGQCCVAGFRGCPCVKR